MLRNPEARCENCPYSQEIPTGYGDITTLVCQYGLPATWMPVGETRFCGKHPDFWLPETIMVDYPQGEE